MSVRQPGVRNLAIWCPHIRTLYNIASTSACLERVCAEGGNAANYDGQYCNAKRCTTSVTYSEISFPQEMYADNTLQD